MKPFYILTSALFALSANAADLSHTYTFDTDVSDSTGDIDLVAHGGAVVDGRYYFDANQGLTLSGGLLDTASYTIEMRFRIDDLNAAFYKKIIDFQGLSTDEGVYLRDASTIMYPLFPIGPDLVESGEDITLIVTRNADMVLSIYIDGVLQSADVTELGVSVDNTLNFFRDDDITGNTEVAAGSVDYIRIIDQPLTFIGVQGLVPPTSSNPVVTRDLFVVGDQMLTYDSSTNFEWLDLTETLDASIDDINGGLGGWTDLGFSVATQSEVTALLQSLGARDFGFDTVLNAEGAQQHFETLGCTFNCTGVNFQRASGTAIDDQGGLGRGLTVDRLSQTDPVSGNIRYTSGSPLDYRNFSTGIYLRRVSDSIDSDGDSVLDEQDNCTLTANPDQRDTDGDGFGNACDADLNNDGTINVVDLGLLRARFFTNDEDADLNGDGVVNVIDLGMLRTNFFGMPGPSGVQF